MANPILNENTFMQNYGVYNLPDIMTKQGVTLKTAGLLALVTIAGAFSWMMVPAMGASANLILIGSIIIGLILGLIIPFKPTWSPFLAPIYAVVEGVFLGAVSCYFEAAMPGIVFQAVVATLAIFFSILALYSSGVIVVTRKVRSVIIALTVSVFVIYLVSFLLSLAGIRVPFIYDASPIGIAINVIIMIIAAANLLIDFDNIEKGINYSAPKYFEWYCAYGTMVTIVWIYIEVLRLLAKLKRR